ncbi:MAG TPA: isochorismatase family protein [Bryobacteraceae bacterium]|nr:isochorismatase family protein [Bryobacteraceae bacterium]
MISIDPKTTALVLIDLQHATVGMPLVPHSGTDVARRGARLATAFRGQKAPVVFVRAEISEFLRLPVDAPIRHPNAPPPPPIASQLVPEADYQTGDLLVTKRSWGAFYSTELDQQLRRRGIRTIVLGGIATNFGVESTARAAFDRGYEVIFAEDAMTSISAEAHGFAVQNIFPRMGRVRKTEELLEALAQ